MILLPIHDSCKACVSCTAWCWPGVRMWQMRGCCTWHTCTGLRPSTSPTAARRAPGGSCEQFFPTAQTTLCLEAALFFACA